MTAGRCLRAVPGPAIVLLGLLAASPARAADPAAPLWASLDGDAPVAVRIDPDQLEQLVEAYRTSGLRGAAQLVFLTSAGASALIGFDPLVAAGWWSAGIDGAVPMVGSVGAIDHRAARAELAMQPGKRAAAPVVLWRSRLALAVDDRGKVDATWSRVGRALPAMTEVAPQRAAAVAAALGANPADGASVVRALRKRGVRAVGRLPLLESLVVLHRRDDVALIDVLTPMGGRSLRWSRDNGAVLAAIDRRGSGLGSRLTRGAGTALNRPGLAVWADATAAYDAAQLAELDLGLRLGMPPASGPHCGDFRDIATSGPFTDVAAAVSLGPPRVHKTAARSVRAQITWGLRGQFKLAGLMLIADDRLIDPGQLVGGNAAAAGALYLRSLEPLRSMPRPKVMSLSRRDFRFAVLGCGPTATVTTLGLGWPQLLGTFLDQVASIHPQAAALVKSARNLVFGLRSGPGAAGGTVGFAEGSFDPSVASYVQGYFDLLFGVRNARTVRGTAVTTWGRGPIRPYRRDVGGRAVFGAALSGAAVDWRGSRPAPLARNVNQLLAELRIDPGRLVGQLPELAWLVPLANRMKNLSVLTRFDQGTLQSFAVADIR